MKVNQQPGYVLHTRPYSETSLLVDIFTPDYGRLMLIAKGARRRKNHTRALLMPFRPLLISWSGKGQLPILTSVEQIKLVAELKGESLSCGYYISELLLKLLHRFDPHEALFICYRETLESLTDPTNLLEPLRIFEKVLLDQIGFGLILDRDAETGAAIDANSQYVYLAEKGPVSKDYVGEHQALGEYFIDGATLIALNKQQDMNEGSLKQAQVLTRSAIYAQLQNKELRSRTVMRDIYRYKSRSVIDAQAGSNKLTHEAQNNEQ